jgi:TatD DNase family protein
VLSSLPGQGVTLVVNPAQDIVSAGKVIGLAERYPHVYAAVGFHPHEASKMRIGDMVLLRELAAHPKVVAIGEIGLDYHYDYSPRDVQQRVLREHLALAQEFSLPVILHDREAHGDVMAVIGEFPQITGVFHCYSGALEQAKLLVRLGWYLSFTGAITFKKRAPLPRCNRVDAPGPAYDRNRRPLHVTRALPRSPKRSSLMYRTAETVAALRGWSLEEAAKITTANGKKFFRIGDAL